MLGMSDGLKEKKLDIEKLYQNFLLLWSKAEPILVKAFYFERTLTSFNSSTISILISSFSFMGVLWPNIKVFFSFINDELHLIEINYLLLIVVTLLFIRDFTAKYMLLITILIS